MFVAPLTATVVAPSADKPGQRGSVGGEFQAMILRLREGGLGGASSDGQMERSIITVPTIYVANPTLTLTPYPCPNPYPHQVRRVVAYWKSRRRSLRRSRMVRLGASRGGAAACGLSSPIVDAPLAGA